MGNVYTKPSKESRSIRQGERERDEGHPGLRNAVAGE